MALRIMVEPHRGSTYEQLLAAATLAQECGFDAFFQSDHYYQFGTPSGLPFATDAWLTMAGLARDTNSIRLGTIVTPVTFRRVGILPVLVGQIDQMSGGRLEIGIGAGWNEGDHSAFGIPFPSVPERFDLLEDQLAILDGVWGCGPGESFSYTGATVSVEIPGDRVRPNQSPHPPVLLGGKAGPRAARLAARYADEYNLSMGGDAAAITSGRRAVEVACEAIGRDPASMVFSTVLRLCCGSNDGEIATRAAAMGYSVENIASMGAVGTPDQILDRLAALSDAGVERFYFEVLDLDDADQFYLVSQQILPFAPSI